MINFFIPILCNDDDDDDGDDEYHAAGGGGRGGWGSLVPSSLFVA